MRLKFVVKKYTCKSMFGKNRNFCDPIPLLTELETGHFCQPYHKERGKFLMQVFLNHSSHMVQPSLVSDSKKAQKFNPLVFGIEKTIP